MKYIKTYEKKNYFHYHEFNLETGCYVLVHDDDLDDKEARDYFNNNIAQVRWGNDFSKEYIEVYYTTTPSDNLIKKYWNNRDDYEKRFNKYSRTISQHNIVAASKDKESVLQIAASKKFNI